MTNTLIENLKDDTNTIELFIEEKKDFDIIEYRKEALNLFAPLSYRVECLLKYNDHFGETIGELINYITGMYFFSRTKVLKEYLIKICSLKEISLLHRIECAKSIENTGYKHIKNMFQEEEKNMDLLPTPIRTDSILFLIQNDLTNDAVKNFFCKIIDDISIDELYRVKIIQGLEKKVNKEKFLYYSQDACLSFLKNINNSFQYKIIISQYIFQKCEPNEELTLFVSIFLENIFDNTKIDYNIRADASDVLIRYGNDEFREKALSIIYELGGGIESRNIFKNAQNVHILSISESVEKIIDKLCQRNENKKWDFDEVKNNIVKKYNNRNIHKTLTRISVDTAIYGKNYVTLSTIFIKIWSYIQDSKHTEELEKRLVEEMEDSSGKCSTAFASHLINTLSGFDDEMSIKISYEDQIIANLENKLNKKIQETEDKEMVDLILEEMTISILEFGKRGNFLKFFKKHIGLIREELYNDFSCIMPSCDFDLYFRKAISHYEGITVI